MAPTGRLIGLDAARYVAFCGMVLVNFEIVMGAEGAGGPLGALMGALHGRAVATFVVLAGIGLGLSAGGGGDRISIAVTLRRAAFLMALGLLNMQVFDADILHYYAVYFLFGAVLLPVGTRTLLAIIAALGVAAVVMVLTLDFDAGWDWGDYSYDGFWTVSGFVRNLFFNGWHPVVPWLGFLIFGIVLARADLGRRAVQHRLIVWGLFVWLAAEATARVLRPVAQAVKVDPELALLVTTGPIPAMPLYILAGGGAACVAIGLCLRGSDALARMGWLAWIAPAGRQTLTLYLAHVLIGMGMLEALGLLGGQGAGAVAIAAGLFCLAATIYAAIWSRKFRRGPVEAAMRRLAG